MTSALQFEVLDLRHFSAGAMRPLLEAESRVWSERLHWDYRGSADLLLQYLDSRVLPGYVAVENGRVVGYAFCVYEGHKAVIGDVYALGAPVSGSQSTSQEIRGALLVRLLEMLQSTPGVSRIESQLLLHAHGEHTAVFEHAGFEVYQRIFMEWPLIPPPALDDEPTANGLAPRRWADSDFAAAGRLIALAYAGHLDSHINEQYRTAAGSQRFLHNIVRFPGCGYFDAEASQVIVDPARGELAGLLLCSRVREDVGHVTQICVAPEFRGMGYGKALMRACARNLAERGFKVLTLTVTASNTNAVALYERLGFRGTHRFDAMVWDPAEHRRG